MGLWVNLWNLLIYFHRLFPEPFPGHNTDVYEWEESELKAAICYSSSEYTGNVTCCFSPYCTDYPSTIDCTWTYELLYIEFPPLHLSGHFIPTSGRERVCMNVCCMHIYEYVYNEHIWGIWMHFHLKCGSLCLLGGFILYLLVLFAIQYYADKVCD